MMTGGIAAIFHGKPRLTHDFDIVVEIETEDILKLINAFKDEFYIDEETIHKAVENRSLFNLIHQDSGIKVDFWLMRDDNFDKKRFERRERHTYSGREIFFSTPEDIILIKLLWHKETQIQKHMDDALGIVEVQQKLDMAYLEEWTEKLTIQEIFNELWNKE